MVTRARRKQSSRLSEVGQKCDDLSEIIEWTTNDSHGHGYEECYKHPQQRMKPNEGAHKHCEETNYHQPDILLLVPDKGTFT